jgi:hypothetical protein
MRFLMSALAAAVPLLGAYTYYYGDSFSTINTTAWQQNGVLSAGSTGLTSSDPNGGALISKIAVPDGSSSYEVQSVIRLTADGGTFVQYLRASQDAKTGPAATGTFYSVELRNPTGGVNPWCRATLVVSQRVGGVLTELSNRVVNC